MVTDVCLTVQQRTTYVMLTAKQNQYLDRLFDENENIDVTTKCEVAVTLGLAEEKVCVYVCVNALIRSLVSYIAPFLTLSSPLPRSHPRPSLPRSHPSPSLPRPSLPRSHPRPSLPRSHPRPSLRRSHPSPSLPHPRPQLIRRNDLGLCTTHVQELHVDETGRHSQYMQMTVENFDIIVGLVEPYLRCQDTFMQLAIEPGLTLAVTLHHLYITIVTVCHMSCTLTK